MDVTSTKFNYFPLQTVKASGQGVSRLVGKRHSRGSRMMTQARERTPREGTTCAGSTKPAQAPQPGTKLQRPEEFSASRHEIAGKPTTNPTEQHP